MASPAPSAGDGAALALLRNQSQSRHAALALSRDLVFAKICRPDGRLADERCESTTEWFVPGTVPPRTGILEAAPHRNTDCSSRRRIAGSARPANTAEFEALSMQIAAVPGFHRVDCMSTGSSPRAPGDSSTIGRRAGSLLGLARLQRAAGQAAIIGGSLVLVPVLWYLTAGQRQATASCSS